MIRDGPRLAQRDAEVRKGKDWKVEKRFYPRSRNLAIVLVLMLVLVLDFIGLPRLETADFPATILFG